MIDSDGDAIDDGYMFELGAFPLDFNPSESNVGQWLAHWRVFDKLTFDPVFGLGRSSTTILNNVTSESQYATDQLTFAGMNAYLWIRKGNELVAGSEWFVGRAENWTFPLVGGDCCSADFIEWSTSNLTASDIPSWGWQNAGNWAVGVEGPGEISSPNGLTNRDGAALQTLTFIPEPSSALLTFFAGFGLLLRRRRNA